MCLSREYKKFTYNVIDHDRGKDIGTEGIGGKEAKPFDEDSHQYGAEEDADPGDRIEEQDLDDNMVPAPLENPQHIRYIGNHIGHQKGQAVANHRVARPAVIVDRADVQLEYSHRMIFLLQGRKYLPADKVKDDDMGEGRESPGQTVLDKLNDSLIVDSH
jgi:hypothetical protein